MKLLPGFIDPEEEREYIEKIRKMSFGEKLAIASKLTFDYRDTVKKELRQLHPDASEREIDLLLVERLYGKDLADRVRAYMKDNGLI